MDHSSTTPTAKRLAGEIAMGAKPQFNDLLFPVPTRLPLDVYSMLEALTHHVGTSRNKMAVRLFQAGIESVLSHLDEATVEQLEQDAAQTAQVAADRNGGLFERGEF